MPVPSPPTGVTATPGNASATVSWTDVAGATSYNVYRSTQGGQRGVLVNGKSGAAALKVRVKEQASGTTAPGGWPIAAGPFQTVLMQDLFTDPETVGPGGVGNANDLRDWLWYDSIGSGQGHDQTFDYYAASQAQVAVVGGIPELQLRSQRVGSELHYAGGPWMPGGVAHASIAGRVDMTFAFDHGSPGSSGVFQMWDKDFGAIRPWPTGGERDALEFGGGERTGMDGSAPQVGMNIHWTATVHATNPGQPADQYGTGTNASIDYSKFHEISYEWNGHTGQEYDALIVDGVIQMDSRTGKGLWNAGSEAGAGSGSFVRKGIPGSNAVQVLPIFQHDASHPDLTTYSTTPCIMHIRRIRMLV